MLVCVDDADAEGDPLGAQRTRRDRRQDAAMQRVLGKPHGGEAGCLGDLGQLDAAVRVELLIEPDADPRQLQRHFRALQMPPGRGAVLASEKCTWTTRQSPASLRNTIVEREMKSTP